MSFAFHIPALGAFYPGIDHNIDEKTVRRIKSDANYTMELNTLYKICESRNISLSDFFKLIEK
ncbi:helix-turn-helix domain-containing protein [Mesonia aestuariivivens]|uniref:Helix-turn-helix transcriptional regulator n=1 Tax=Mesonia aestuariivivens TaxID=2796128 RepID=A0ABS6W4V6_9FLAO|nr:helix-turn-helix domain-containing protein [Mesonia aestuariivivens]MBW2962901.1 helix-turn-helix transcriptional regulator [Mesonia aestuariivivens]